jgi:hypothetical protein
MIPAFERTKTVHAFDGETTVIGLYEGLFLKYSAPLKVEVRQSCPLCFIKYEVMKTCGRVETEPQAFLTSVLNGSEWSASRLGRFTHVDRGPATNLIDVGGYSSVSHLGSPGSISCHVGFAVDKVALGRIVSDYFGFPCLLTSHQLLRIHQYFCHPTLNDLDTDTVVKQRNVT